MNFVVDASITAAWLLPDEKSEPTDQILARLSTGTAYVPALWPFEIRNILIMAERRHRLTADMADQALRLVARFPLTIDQEIDHMRCHEIARSKQLTYYDAAYLELAVRLELPIATLDKALSRAAGDLGLLLNVV